MLVVIARGDATVLKNSVLDIVNQYFDSTPVLEPDLAIYKVKLRKIADPKENFNYYRYYATVIIENKGRDLQDAKVKLSAGDGQQQLYVKNSAEGFSLKHGKKYIIDKYEVIFDGALNGGEVPFKIDLNELVDSDEIDNQETVAVLELPAGLKEIQLESVKDNGDFVLDLSENREFYNYNLETFVANDLEVLDGTEEYLETKEEAGRYGYYRILNSEQALASENWVKTEESSLQGDGENYIYVKATNPENGRFAVSDILILQTPKNLNNAEFAKAFVEETKEKVGANLSTSFSDVSSNEWYAPYVKALYDLGLLDFNQKTFEPTSAMTRGKALKMVMEYYDADITGDAPVIEVNDVEKDDDLYNYLANFPRYKKLLIDGSFEPMSAVDLAFVKYLIYAHQ